MAFRVPVTQLKQPLTQPQVMPVVQIQPSGLEQLSQGFDKLQRGVESYGADQFKMDMDAKEAADNVKVMDTYVQASGARADLWAEAQKAQGEQAIGITERMKEKYNKILEKLNEGLINPEQVAASRRQTVELYNGLENSVNAHEHAQVKVMQHQKYTGTIDISVSDGIKFHNYNAAKLGGAIDEKENKVTYDALAAVKGATEKFGSIMGWPQKEVDAKTLDGTSAIHLGIVKDLIRRKDYDFAQQYIVKNIEEIDGKKMVALDIYGQIKAGKDEQVARDLLNAYPPSMPLPQVLADLRRRTRLAPGSEGFVTADVYNLAQQRGATDYHFDEGVRKVQSEQAVSSYWNQINGVGIRNKDGAVVRGWMAHSDANPDFVRLDEHGKNTIRALVSQDQQKTHALEGEALREAQRKDGLGHEKFKLLSPEEQASADIVQWAFQVGTDKGMDHLAFLQRVAKTAVEKKLIPEKAMVESLIKTAAENSPGLNPVDNKYVYGQFHARVMGEWHREVLAGKTPNRNKVAEIIASNIEAGYGDVMNFLKHIPIIGWPIDPAYKFEFNPGQSFNLAHQEDQLSPEWITTLRTGVAPLPDWLTPPPQNMTPFPQAVAPSQIDFRILSDIRRRLSQFPQYSNGVPDRAAVDTYNAALRNGARPDAWLREIDAGRSGRTGERP